ncbi:MAG: trigger factor [Rhabdochlamydiaceae bacterium]|nr:trigger factor [Rhabdochlamydiaceae bacterium]
MENSLPQTFNNSLITCVVNKKPGCQIELEVTASRDLISSSQSQAIKYFAKGVSIPGFRKGKVPEAMILQRFAKECREKHQEIVMQKALQESLALTKIQPFNPENVSFKAKSFTEDSASFLFFFEVAPTIPQVDPSTFQLQEVKRPVVDAEKIQETIRQTLFFYAKWDKVESRPIVENDFVLLDMDVIEVDPPSSLFSNTRFEVVDRSMAKWLKDLILGKTPGDVVEGISVPDETADPLEKETLKPQKVRVTIKSIEKPTLPEMTPELFKNLGVESEEDFKNKVEKLLQEQADQHVKEKQREQVREFLLEKYPFDLPPTLLGNELRFRVSQLNQSTEFLDYWRTLKPEEQLKLREVIQSQSEKAVKLFHLSEKLLRDNKLSPSPYSLPKSADTALEALINPNPMQNYHQSPDVKRAEVLSKLILEQAEDYIIAQATGNVVG